jgi:hypothetical protein
MNGFSHPVLISLTLLPYLVWYKNDDKILFLGLIYPDKPGMVIRAQYWRIFSEQWFHDRPEWGIFDHIFPDSCYLSVELRIINCNARKTGLFKPVWLAKLHSDGLKYVEWGKRCFGHAQNSIWCRK